MDIWLFSLVLLSIFIGWVLGRWRPFRKNAEQQNTSRYSEKYAKGLNYLLSDDSDKAIQVFTDLIAVSKETIEVHITLGNLFRSRGEVDRAIKLHQSLLARPNLTSRQRNLAIAELANDYMKAGLFDRAEKLYKEMTQLSHFDSTAYWRLTDMYVAEKSWQEAADSVEILYNKGDAQAAIVLSQCLCEIATLALADGNKKLLRDSLSKALVVDKNCVRAALLLIQFHLDTDNFSAAKKLFQSLVKRNPEYMPLYIEPARKIYLHGMESSVYQNFLQHQYQQNPSTRLAVALVEHYAANNRMEKARDFLSEILNRSPSFEAFDFALRFLKSNPDSLEETWHTLSSFLKTMQDKKTEFICSQCGYESHSIHWHCPSCSSWSSMKPV